MREPNLEQRTLDDEGTRKGVRLVEKT